MSKERILKEAEIEPSVVSYHLLSIAVVLTLTIVGIPLLIVALPLAGWYWRRYYERLRVVLTTREMKVSRGIFFREEKTIPLEKITDLAVYEGPIMRRMNLKGIRIETAGQTSGPSALVSIVGIKDTDGFRDLVLTQRDRVADRDDVPAGAATASAPTASSMNDGALLATLEDVRDTLHRIEAQLGQRDS